MIEVEHDMTMDVWHIYLGVELDHRDLHAYFFDYDWIADEDEAELWSDVGAY